MASQFNQSHPALDLPSLISEGSFELLKAFHRFDPNQGRFSTLAHTYVSNAFKALLKKNTTALPQAHPASTQNDLSTIKYTDDETIRIAKKLQNSIDSKSDDPAMSMLIEHYGLFEKPPKVLKEIGAERGISAKAVHARILGEKRRLALHLLKSFRSLTPEESQWAEIYFNATVGRIPDASLIARQLSISTEHSLRLKDQVFEKLQSLPLFGFLQNQR
jgi:DNA-directed RNA polymerase specialized sigma subunit